MNKQAQKSISCYCCFLLRRTLWLWAYAYYWGFVQCEQQKHQNKYGYNRKCHSNEWYKISQLSIYTLYLFIYYYCYCYDFYFDFIVVLFLYCYCCWFLCLFINSHFSLSVASDIWLGYVYWYLEAVIHIRQKYYPFSTNWLIWQREREFNRKKHSWLYPGFKYDCSYTEKCLYRFDSLLGGHCPLGRELKGLFYTILFWVCVCVFQKSYSYILNYYSNLYHT